MKEVRFTDAEYAILVLQGFKRMIKRSDYYQGFLPPRNVFARDHADGNEVTSALQYAIDMIRNQEEGHTHE